jgi:hypothetical protein
MPHQALQRPPLPGRHVDCHLVRAKKGIAIRLEQQREWQRLLGLQPNLAAIRRSQWLTSVDFPTPAQATTVTTLTFLFAQARSRKAISSSRPKTSLPVTGNLAREIFSGPGLVEGLRIATREGVEAVFCRLRRVILRRVSIAPIIVGTAFSNSFGVWKRCAGSF